MGLRSRLKNIVSKRIECLFTKGEYYIIQELDILTEMGGKQTTIIISETPLKFVGIDRGTVLFDDCRRDNEPKDIIYYEYHIRDFKTEWRVKPKTEYSKQDVLKVFRSVHGHGK